MIQAKQKGKSGYPNTIHAVSRALESQTPNDEIGCQARRRRRAQHSCAGSRRNNAWRPILAISKRRLRAQARANSPSLGSIKPQKHSKNKKAKPPCGQLCFLSSPPTMGGLGCWYQAAAMDFASLRAWTNLPSPTTSSAPAAAAA